MKLPTLLRHHGHGDAGPSNPPVLLHIRSSKWFILFTISVAIFTDIFLYGVIVPVIPFALSLRAGVKEADVQHWVSVLLAVYSAALLVSAPFLGWIADRVKARRGPLLAGLLLLAGATLMLMLGRSVAVLVAGRLLQGLSAGVVWVAGLAVLADTTGSDDIGETMGIVSLAYSLGILIAPLLGGVVYQSGGYYSVFYMAFGLIFLDIVLRFTFIEKKIAARYLPPTESNHELESRTSRRTSDTANRTGPESAPARRKYPPIFYLASSRRMLAAFWGIMVMASLATAFDSTLPLYAHRTFGFDSRASGLLFLSLLLPNFLAPISGKISDRYGPRWIGVSGFVVALPFFVLLRLVNHKTTGQIVLLCALLAFIGFSLMLSMPPLMAEFTLIVESKQRQRPDIFGPAGAYAQAYGMFNAAWAAGSIIGPLWAGFIQQKAGWETMTWTLGLLSVVSAVPIAVYTGGFIVRRKREGDDFAA